MTMHVLVVSTHRSDKAHYDRLLRVLRADKRFRVTLYAYNRAYEGGAPKDPVTDMRPLARTRHKGEPEHFDAGVVLGDRYEMLIAAMQIVEARIPLLHIHGGEHTYGSLDERWRWAMTEIADVHCVAHDEAAEQIRANVADASIVHVTGAPGLDEIGAAGDDRPIDVLVHYNPARTRIETCSEWVCISAAMTGVQGESAVVTPNGDRFSDAINTTVLHASDLNHVSYRAVLGRSRVIVGNSSAGIIEAPSLGTWAVNIGERQAGRVRAGNVIDVPADADAIRAAILDALARPRFAGPNPYRHPEGKACEAIRDVLLEMGGAAMTLAMWDPRTVEQRCECFNVRLDVKHRASIEWHHMRFVHAGRFPGYGRCMATVGYNDRCPCEKFRPREER